MNKTKSKSKSNIKFKYRNSNKTRKNKSLNRVFTKEDYKSGDGMLTSVWGPPMWHFLHTMSFNYPINPTAEDKKNYSNFIYDLRYVLPCKYCRINLTSNLKANPLLDCHMKTRETFSKFIFRLHEIVNKRLGKTSGLSYCDVRERYEHFRSRCTKNDAPPKLFNFSKKKEKGCTEPLYGHKAKCVLSIVPQTTDIPSFQVDNKCVKYKVKKDEK
jgi:Erv1 / Alr family